MWFYLASITSFNVFDKVLSVRELVKGHNYVSSYISFLFRLPAYVKGVPKRVSSASPSGSPVPGSHPASPVPHEVILSQSLSSMRTRAPIRSRSSSSNSSVGDHSSTELQNTTQNSIKKPIIGISVVNPAGMTTRSRTTPNSTPMGSNGVVSSSRRRRNSSSSSSSSSSPSELRSPRQKKRRTWRKPQVQVPGSESSGSKVSGSNLDRSRSPAQDRWKTRLSAGAPVKQVQQRQVEERRVVYVGRISEGTTRADLRKRFEAFGPIEEISVHFRDRG